MSPPSSDAYLPVAPSSLLHLLPHAIDIALLATPEVAADRLIAPEAAIPIYLRDNVAHVAQPPKPAAAKAS